MKSNRIMSLIRQTPDGEPIDKELVRRICSCGLSEAQPDERCFAWLILFGVYPRFPSKWAAKLDTIYEDYKRFVSDYKLDDWLNVEIPKHFSKKDFTNIVDNDFLMYDIHTDVVRSSRNTYFLPAMDPPKSLENDKTGPFIYHLRRFERILYIFGSLNPILKYIQGFNELLIPIYFVITLAKEHFNNDFTLIEALAFQCFQHLMTSTNIIDFFLISDLSVMDIKFSYFKKVLNKHAPKAAKILEYLDISPFEYVYKWLNILFAQEYELPSLLILWDSMFAKFDDLMNYACYIAAAKILEIEDELDKNYFTKTVMALQTERNQNIYSIIKKANELYNKDFK